MGWRRWLVVEGTAVLQSVCKKTTLHGLPNNHNILWFIPPPPQYIVFKGRTNRDLTYSLYVVLYGCKPNTATATATTRLQSYGVTHSRGD